MAYQRVYDLDPYSYKPRQVVFRDDASQTLRLLVRDIVLDYRDGKLVMDDLAAVPVIRTRRARVAEDNCLLGSLGADLDHVEPVTRLTIPVVAGIRLDPYRGRLVIQDQSTYGATGDAERFGTISTRRLASDYYRYARRHNIASPMQFMDEMVFTPLAAVGMEAMALQ